MVSSAQIARDADGGAGQGSKITFDAVYGSSYFIVLEPDHGSDDCGNATITFSVTDLPGETRV